MMYNCRHSTEVEMKKLGRNPRINHDEVIRQIQEIRLVKTVAINLNLSEKYVQSIARKYKIQIDDQRGKHNQNPRTIFLDKKLVVQRYLSGEGTNEIGKSLNIDGEVVRRRLKKWNIPRRVGKAIGPKNPQWKGNRSAPMHYFRKQSYEVAAICLGQPVPKGYVIHHLDENAKNNNPENLILFPSQSLHAKFHQKVLNLRLEVDSKESNQLMLEIGGVQLPKPPHPLTFLQNINNLYPSNSQG